MYRVVFIHLFEAFWILLLCGELPGLLRMAMLIAAGAAAGGGGGATLAI